MPPTVEPAGKLIAAPVAVTCAAPKYNDVPLRYKSLNFNELLPMSYASVTSGMILPLTVPSRFILLSTPSTRIVESSAYMLPLKSAVSFPLTERLPSIVVVPNEVLPDTVSVVNVCVGSIVALNVFAASSCVKEIPVCGPASSTLPI